MADFALLWGGWSPVPGVVQKDLRVLELIVARSAKICGALLDVLIDSFGVLGVTEVGEPGEFGEFILDLIFAIGGGQDDQFGVGFGAFF